MSPRIRNGDICVTNLSIYNLYSECFCTPCTILDLFISLTLADGKLPQVYGGINEKLKNQMSDSRRRMILNDYIY